MALEGYEAWDTFEDRFQVHLAFEDGWAYLKAARITYRQGEPVTNGHWWAGRYSVETGATGKVRVRFKKRKARRRWRFEK